jgi:hypothetical protein
MFENLMLRRALFSAASGVIVWLLFATAGSFVQVTEVSASASYDAEHGPERSTDGFTQETPNGSPSWLLPNGQTGSIRFSFAAPQRLDAVRILNTRNRLYFDRATENYRLAIVDSSGEHVVAKGKLRAYPQWETIALDGRVAESAILYVDSYTTHGGGLAEVAFAGAPAHGVPWRLLFAFSCALLAAVTYPRLSARLEAPSARPLLVLVVLLAFLTAWGLRSLRFYTSVSTFEWLLLFEVREFTTWAETARFFAELRVPIPPWLALLEIAAYRSFGNTDLITRDFYMVSIVAGHGIAVALMYPSIKRMFCAFVFSAACVAATGAVHQANPQIYDTAFGFTITAFLGSAVMAARAPSAGLRRPLWLAIAGLFLALCGLTRPFALFLLPLPIAFVLARFADQRPRGWLAFLAPVVLLCGLWHAQLLVRHGQLGMSNHTGYNMHRAWPMAPVPPLIREDESPPYRGVNNPDHLRNSKLLQQAVIQYIVEHPSRSLAHVLERLVVVLNARTDFPARQDPRGPTIAPYQLAVRLLMALALFATAVRSWQVITRLRDWRQLRAAQLSRLRFGDLSLLLTVGTMLLIALGESGEESRFVVSFLPLLVTVLGTAVITPQRFPSEPSSPN